jgi:hypothetical protein
MNNENDKQYQLKIQKVLHYDDLPGTFKGRTRQEHSLSGEVWLQDESFQTITISQISGKAAVMIEFHYQHISERITEILYKHKSRWHIRDVAFSYQHPFNYITIR